jgi:uncharacterized protein YjbI with pentapeptide repeats
MKTNRTSDTDLAAPPVHGSGTGSILWLLGPLMVLGVLGYINSIGAWPAFRQQDTSILHWILASNPEALKGLTHDIKTEPDKPSIQGRNGLWNLLRNYLTLENINLSGLDLSSTDFGDMSLENVNLAGARLVNTDFSCADLTRVDFSGAKLMYSKFDYSKCPDHISTKGVLNKGSQCSRVSNIIMTKKWPFYPPLDSNNQLTYSCLEGTFVGADFSNAQIRGVRPRSRSKTNKDKNNDKEKNKDNYCDHLLVLVGNMSGANFNNAKLTCVALLHRSDTQVSGNQPNKDKNNRNGDGHKNPEGAEGSFTFNGINFTEARLDRVSLLEGPFRFTQFERANLKGLFLNLDKADLDYSRFNEIQCKEPAKDKQDKTYSPCLWVQRGDGSPLHLNLLWSTLVTNLKPIQKDRFLCTPSGDLPASVEDKLVVSAGYWLSTQTEMKFPATTELQECPSDHLLPKQVRQP